MWGLDVALRVRDRKASELERALKFTNLDRRFKLAGELGRDIEICNCVIGSCSICAIPSAPISDPGYRQSLSPQESSDEDDLDSVRHSAPDMREFIREALLDASESIAEDRSAPYKEALASMKGELAACRDRIEDLSASLDYKSSELIAAEEDRDGLKETIAQLEAQIESLRRGCCPTEDTEAETAPAETSPQNTEENGPKSIFSKDYKALMAIIKEMKSSKIDYFVDRMFSGKEDPDVCDGIVSFLKSDIDTLRMLCDVREGDRESMETAFREIVRAMHQAPSPEQQSAYLAAMTDGEKVLEISYNEIISRVEDMIEEEFGGFRDRAASASSSPSRRNSRGIR